MAAYRPVESVGEPVLAVQTLEPKQILSRALSGKNLVAEERKKYVIVSFADSNRDLQARSECFNCCTAFLGGSINHVEISFPGGNSTAGVTIREGSFSTVNKPFKSIYIHYVVLVGADREKVIRTASQQRLDREYDRWGLLDTLFCGISCFTDPEKETCARMVIRSLREAGIIPESASIQTPQELYYYMSSDYFQTQYTTYVVDLLSEQNEANMAS